MLVVRENVESWVREYDREKGFFRCHFADHPAIRNLKNLLNNAAGRPSFHFEALYVCFQNHPVTVGHESYKTFLSILNDQIDQLIKQYESALHLHATGDRDFARILSPDYYVAVEDLLNTVLNTSFLSAESRASLYNRLSGIHVRVAESSLPSHAANPYTLCPTPRRSEGDEYPEDMLCPITGELMRDPAYLTTNPKYVCERSALVAWVSEKKTCPSTRKRCSLKHIISATDLRKEIDQYLRQDRSSACSIM